MGPASMPRRLSFNAVAVALSRSMISGGRISATLVRKPDGEHPRSIRVDVRTPASGVAASSGRCRRVLLARRLPPVARDCPYSSRKARLKWLGRTKPKRRATAATPSRAAAGSSSSRGQRLSRSARIRRPTDHSSARNSTCRWRTEMKCAAAMAADDSSGSQRWRKMLSVTRASGPRPGRAPAGRTARTARRPASREDPAPSGPVGRDRTPPAGGSRPCGRTWSRSPPAGSRFVPGRLTLDDRDDKPRRLETALDMAATRLGAGDAGAASAFLRAGGAAYRGHP